MTTEENYTATTERPAAASMLAPQPIATAAYSHIRKTPTPQLLSRLRLLCIIMLLFFGVSASLAIRESQSAANTANQATEQFSRIHDIEAHVMAANAVATHDLAAGNSISIGYSKEITQAYQQITPAALAVPRDRDQLTTLTEQLQSYDNAISKAAVARAGTNQTASISEAAAAQSVISTKILPTIDEIASRNRNQLSDKGTVWLLIWLWLTGTFALLCLLTTGTALAFRTHRMLNLGIVGAVLFILLTLSIGQLSIGSTSYNIATTQTNSLQQLDAAANARTAVFSAKSLEGLDLLARSQANEEKIQQALTTARNNLSKLNTSPAATDQFEAVITSHEKVRDANTAKNYAEALANNGDATATTFGQTLRNFSDQLSTTAVTTSSKNTLLRLGALVAVLSCLSAVILCNIGIGRRLGDYR